MKEKFSHIIAVIAIGIGSSVFIIVLSVLFSGLITSFENKTLDYRFKLRGNLAVHPDIVLIDIDDESMRNIGRWPWDRGFHGKMIGMLAKSNAAAIGYDILFDQPATKAGDTTLITASAGVKNLYYPVGFALGNGVDESMGSKDSDTSSGLLKKFVLTGEGIAAGHIMHVEKSVAQFKELMQTADGAGHISSNRDADGTIRRVPLVVNLDGKYFPAFGLSLTAAYLKVLPENISVEMGSHILLKDATIP